MRVSCCLLLLVLCAGAIAHPYPYHYANRTRFRSSQSNSTRSSRRGPDPQQVAPVINDSHLPSHLRVSHSPLPATIGGGRTLPSSAFYALRFTLSKNLQRNTKNHKSTFKATNHSPLSEASSSGETTQESLRNHSHLSSQSPTQHRTNSSSQGNSTLSSQTSSPPYQDERAKSLSEKAARVFKALGLKGLQHLLFSIAQPKLLDSDDTFGTNRTFPSVSGETDDVEKFTLPPNDTSVKLSEDTNLSEILGLLLKAAQNESDTFTTDPEPPNEATTASDSSQVSPNNSSSAQNRTKTANDGELLREVRMNATKEEATHEPPDSARILATNIPVMTHKFTKSKSSLRNRATGAKVNASRAKGRANRIKTEAIPVIYNSSYVLADKIPFKAYVMIQKLNGLVHLVNETGSKKENMSQNGNSRSLASRVSQPDELLLLAKRHVMDLYRAIILEGSNIKHQITNGTVAFTSLSTNTKLSEGVNGIGSEDNEDVETENEDPNNELSEALATPLPLAPVSSTVPSEGIGLGSSGENPETMREGSEGIASSSSTVTTPSPSSTATMGGASVEDAEDGMNDEWETGAVSSQSAIPSPTFTSSVEVLDSANTESQIDDMMSTPLPSGHLISVPPMAVPMNLETTTMPEKNYAVRDGENMTQLSEMVYKVAREEDVFSMAAAPCDEVTDWMPDVVRRLQNELVGFQFYCVDTRRPAQDMSPLRRVFADVATDFVQIGADDIKDSIPEDLDMVVSWKGLQRWGMERGWHFLRGLRDSGAKFVLVSNNPGIMNMEANERAVNVRNSPLLFGEPRRVVGGVTRDNSLQLLLYAMDDIRNGF
ncbi:unnamed protein product [Agarophyton chilense]